MTWVCIYLLGFHVSSGLHKKVINCLDSQLQRNAWIHKHDSSSLQFMRFAPAGINTVWLDNELFMGVRCQKNKSNGPANYSGSSFFFFFTQTGEERAVGGLMCLFIQLLNVSCSIKILNLDNIQEQWNEGIFPQRICRQYMYSFSPVKTPPAVHQTLSVFEREHKVGPLENKCVWICARLPAAALARLPPCWLYCVQTDGSPTAEPAHCFNMFWQGRLKHSSQHPSAAGTMKGRGPSLL